MIIDLPKLEELARCHHHIVRKFNDSPENLWWGEVHGDLDCIQAQLKFIKQYGVEIVLHELFDTRIYNPATKGFSVRRDAPRNRQQDYYVTPPIAVFLKAADRYGFKLVGCDLTHQEKEDKLNAKLQQSIMYREFGGMRVKAILGELEVPEDDDSTLQDAIDPERHREMAGTFLDYAKLTDRPVLAIAGKHHAADSSSIHTAMKGRSYCVIERKE